MRVTIIRDSNAVNVDGVGYAVDCSALPADFHVLQWYGQAGEIEYNMTVCAHCSGRNKKPNAVITDMAPYLSYVDAWGVAKAAALAAEQAAHDAATKAAFDQQAALAQAAADQKDAIAAAVAEAVREHMDNAARSQG